MKPQLLFAFIFIIFTGGITSEDSSYVQNFHDHVLGHLNGDLSSTAVNEQRAPVYVTIKNGTIKGFTARAINDRTVHTYQRIPFAKPPIGERRFKVSSLVAAIFLDLTELNSFRLQNPRMGGMGFWMGRDSHRPVHSC